jgi:hypothetical protein
MSGMGTSGRPVSPLGGIAAGDSPGSAAAGSFFGRADDGGAAASSISAGGVSL